MKYRPSNGTEGMIFMEEWCDNCLNQPESSDDGECEILGRTLIYGINEPEYPTEWIYKDGIPTCTAYKFRDIRSGGLEIDRDADHPDQLKLF